MLAVACTAQTPADLPTQLRQGGYVLVMRHAHSPTEAPAPANADPANVTGERQLDAEGKAQAHGFGQAIKTLGIRFDRVLSSPAFRARETVELAGLGNPEPLQSLAMSEQQVMMAAADEPSGAQLRALAAQRPRAGTNTLIVTHKPNILAAFQGQAKDIQDAETIVLRSDGAAAKVVGRIRANDWQSLETKKSRGGN